MSEKIISIPFLNTFIQQSTESTMVNIKSIVDIVNQKRAIQGKCDIEINKYLDSEGSTEYINTHLCVMGVECIEKASSVNPRDAQDESNIEKASPQNCGDAQIEVIEDKKFTMSELKELGLYKLTKGKNAGIWFHPMIAIDIVGWMDDEIRYYFNSIVAKELFKGREDVSLGIRKLTDLIVKTWGRQEEHIYIQLNMAINKKIYGLHYKEIRNLADDDSYDKMKLLFTKLTFYIEEGIIHTVPELYSTIQKIKID